MRNKKNNNSLKAEDMDFSFITRISHALRTPLSITKEGISLVLDRIPGQINKKQEKILIVARDNIDRMDRTLDELLKAYKIESQNQKSKEAPCVEESY